MTEAEIIEGNRLIMQFMPDDRKDATDKWLLNACKYHSSWDWLMPVVEKIESMNIWFEIRKNIVKLNGFVLQDGISVEYSWFGGTTSESKIICTYYGVIAFIKWYNENKK